MNSWDLRTLSSAGGCLFILRTWVRFSKSNLKCFLLNLTKILGFRLIFNLKVYFTAKRRLPEFSGLHGRTIPIQDSPRPIKILPRGQELPRSFDKDWREIGFMKQTQSSSTILIIVTPADVQAANKTKIENCQAQVQVQVW